MKWKQLIPLPLLLTALAAYGQVDLQLTRIAERASVVDIKHAGDGSGRLFLVSKFGSIHIYRNGTVLESSFLDIGGLISRSGEQGLLSMAFAPDYAQSGVFYVYYTDTSGFSTIARYRVSADADIADPASAEILLTEQQPFTNHNGGRLEFGPDGMLYLGIGDGGDANDPFGNGQDLRTLLGSLIRIDVSQTSGYSVPPDNPFINQSDARDEIWAYGLRNPWRMAFDSMTGDLYIADVGQNNIEEINVQPASSGGGENYGWALFEGCVSGNCDGTVIPAFQYDHDDGDCSVTGGQVYRGQDYPDLQGLYVYGDFCSGRIWGLRNSGSGQFQNQLLLETGTLGNLTTFGEDELGNIYVSASLGVEPGVFLISDGPPVQSTGIAIDGSLSGTYVVEGLNDQGFFVTVGSNESGTFVFVAWFTFNEIGDPLWLVGVDFYEPGATAITLTMERVFGLPFLDFSDNNASRETFGVMTFAAAECGVFQGDYDFGNRGSGGLTLNRLTNIEGRDCSD